MICARPHLVFLLSLISILLGSCSNSTSSPDVRLDILESWADNVIEPSFAEFVQLSEALAVEAAGTCDDTSPDLTEAKARWSEVRGAWKRLEPYYFGPHRAPPARLGQTIDFTPVREPRIIEFMSGDTPVTADGLQQQGAILRGLPVLEFLLFAHADSNPELYVVGETGCLMLVAASADLVFLSQRLYDAWFDGDGAYINELTNPSDGEFMSAKEAFGEIVNRMGFAIENIRRDRLGAPLGDKSGGSIQPDSVESSYSGRSIQDIEDVLDALDLITLGNGGLGLFDHPGLAARPRLITRFNTAMAASREALRAIPGTLRDSLSEPQYARAAYDTLLEVQRSIQGDFMNVLGLTLAFNDADGD